MIVPTPPNLVRGDDGIWIPSRGGGSISALGMTDADMADRASAPKHPIGFAPPFEIRIDPALGECAWTAVDLPWPR